MIRLARCINCRSHDITRKRAGEAGSMDTCQRCGTSYPTVPGTIPASRVGRKRKAASMSREPFNLSTAEVSPLTPALTLDSRLTPTVNGQPAKYLWRELIRCGDFKHPRDGRQIPVNPQRLNEWASNFKRMQKNGVKVYVPVNHSSRTEDNRGYVIDMRERDGRLEGLLQLIGTDAERDAARSEISVKIVPGFEDGGGNRYGEVIEHASLVVNPVIPNQQPAIAASRGAAEGETYTLSGEGDGYWVTINGEHVFIKGGGEEAAGGHGTTPRLAVLRESLKKKEALFDQKIAEHMGDVRSANGQPLNDKSNGGATVNRWERQNDSLRSLKQSIEKTKAAIEREESLIGNVAATETPDFLQQMVESGELRQWRQYPETFFVAGVDKGRIVWNQEHGTLGHRYTSEIPKEQYPKFRDAFNKANAALRERAAKKLSLSTDSTADRMRALLTVPRPTLKLRTA